MTAATSEPGRILLVDDDEDLLTSMRIVLERAGYDVASARHGTAAIAAQRERPAAVLITDIFMPEQDGIETIVVFKRDFPTVRIIAMSGGGRGMGSHTYGPAVSALGVDAMLRKPFHIDVLLTALRELRSTGA